MAPVKRAQKKRKTSAATATPVTTTTTTTAAATPASPARTKSPQPPTPTADASDDDDDDKYESGSDSSLGELDDEFSLASDSSADDSDDSISSLMAAQQSLQQQRKKRKRTDANAFATSMSKILGSHLTTTARKDPVLVRAKQTAEHVDDGKLEAKAKRVMKEELRKEKEKGRLRELVPKDDDAAAARALEKERMLRSIARSGVAKLYNAVRAAQIKGEAAQKGVMKEGIVGIGNREAKGMDPSLSTVTFFHLGVNC